MNALNANIDGRLSVEFWDCKHIVKTDFNDTSLYTWCALHMHEFTIILIYLHFHCESLNEPLHLRCGSYLHEQIALSHTHIRAI